LNLLMKKNDSVFYGKIAFKAFHASNRGSTPRGDANNKNKGLGKITGPFFLPWIFISRPISNLLEKKPSVIVALEACSGRTGYAIRIAENTGDPLAAVAAATLRLPCSCMSPNQGRLALLAEMIARFRPDVVIDVILHACHGYNVES